MLKEIIVKEILKNIISPKLVVSFLLCTILILLSVYLGTVSYKEELDEYNAAVILNRKNLEANDSYGSIGIYGTKIIKYPEVLSIVTAGIRNAVGRQVTIDVRTIPSLTDTKYNGNMSLAIFGELDLILIVKIVLSLFVILFTYDTIAGEKELGTLRLTLSNNLSRHKHLLGKVIGGGVSLLFPFIIPLVMAFILLSLNPNISLSTENWIRIGLILVLFFFYLSVFFTLSLYFDYSQILGYDCRKYRTHPVYA